MGGVEKKWSRRSKRGYEEEELSSMGKAGPVTKDSVSHW